MREDPITGSAMREALKAVDENRQAVLAARQFLKNTDIGRAAEAMRASQLAIRMNFPGSELQDAIKRATEMTSAFREPEFLKNVREMNDLIRQTVIAVQPTVLPAASAAQQLAREIASAVAPYEGAFREFAMWQKSLAERMTLIRSSWALEAHIDVSVLGFARLSRLSDAAHTPVPFSEPVSELISDELGDGRFDEEEVAPLERDAEAVEGGLHPELIAFAPNAYSEVTYSAGFRFSMISIEPPRAIEAEDPSAVYDPMHWKILMTLENALRKLVETEMQKLEGHAWLKRRVSGGMRERWEGRQAEERDAGRPVYDLIYHADFMDLADVICQGNNWPSFAPIFRRKEDFRVSLERLHPIRKAISHGRPLGRAAVLTLVSEATRVLQALKVAQVIG